MQGIFITVCALYWHKECTITEDELNQKLGKSRVKLLVDEKFLLQQDNNIIIPFLDEQMKEFIDIQEKRRKAGKKGGQASVKQRLSKNQPKVKHLDKDKDKDKDKEEDKDKDKKEKKSTGCEILDPYPFSEFWDLYDKKIGKKDKVEKKWNKLSEETRKQIMEYIPHYRKAQPNKQYRKNPETFLNNEGWKDEIISNKPKGVLADIAGY